jgi:NADP-dependent aldehyde dehydrogenase
MITGKHLIKGQWISGPTTFQSSPISGDSFIVNNANEDLIDQAAKQAYSAFKSFKQTSSKERAEFLRCIAKHIDLRGDDITKICGQETGLPEARLIGERGRTTGQLNMFADFIEDGKYLQQSKDEELPQRSPIPRPELRKMMRPFGPVAVFGASNFPLAFSTAGGDTASALAAGCPVVVKGHPAHPATSEIIAQAVLEALKECGIDRGVFSLVQDSGISAAQSLVQHPRITAVGFTGSLQGGRALFDLCNQRPSPIPFYGEMGSLNPVFVMNDSLKTSGVEIASGWVDSLNLGVGQFCTKPGLLVLPKSENIEEFILEVKNKLNTISPTKMLTKGITDSYVQGVKKIKGESNVESLYLSHSNEDGVLPNVFLTDASTWMESTNLHDEIFGPYAMIVTAEDKNQILELAKNLDGQLTATLFMTESDLNEVEELFSILEEKAGRVLANGYPTGVEVAESMVHGGPYPACTYVGTTSVGTTAIQRFLRPVCYQNIPKILLPKDMQDIK